jgi:hypothetical protein
MSREIRTDHGVQEGTPPGHDAFLVLLDQADRLDHVDDEKRSYPTRERVSFSKACADHCSSTSVAPGSRPGKFRARSVRRGAPSFRGMARKPRISWKRPGVGGV